MVKETPGSFSNHPIHLHGTDVGPSLDHVGSGAVGKREGESLWVGEAERGSKCRRGEQWSVSVSATLRPPCSVTVVFHCLALGDWSRASRIPSLVCEEEQQDGEQRKVVLVRGALRGGCICGARLGALGWTVGCEPRLDLKGRISSVPMQLRSVTGGEVVIWARVIDPGMVRTSHETFCTPH